jgi:hypothetical protein
MPRLCYVPVKIPEAGKLVDLDGVPEPGEVNGVQLLLDEREVVPDQAGLDDLLLICCPHQALGRAEGSLIVGTGHTLRRKSHLCIPFMGIAPPRSPNFHVSVSDLYIPRIGCSKIDQQSWKYINLSQIYSYVCRNCEIEQYNSGLERRLHNA